MRQLRHTRRASSGRARQRLRLYVGCAVSISLLFGCATKEEPTRLEETTQLDEMSERARAAENMISPRAPAWLAQMSEAARSAEAARDEGALARAEQILRRALEQPIPEGLHAADARVVQQDLCFALSDLLLESDPEKALGEASRCLAEKKGTDLFSANLLTVRGRALEALGKELEASEAYHEALKINDALLRRRLSGDSHPPGPRTQPQTETQIEPRAE